MRIRYVSTLTALALVLTACGGGVAIRSTTTAIQSITPDALRLSYTLESGTTFEYEVGIDQQIDMSATGDASAMGDEEIPGDASIHLTGTTTFSHSVAEGPKPDTYEITIKGDFTDLQITGTIDGEPIGQTDLPDFAELEPIDVTIVVDDQGNIIPDDDMFDDAFGGGLGGRQRRIPQLGDIAIAGVAVGFVGDEIERRRRHDLRLEQVAIGAGAALVADGARDHGGVGGASRQKHVDRNPAAVQILGPDDALALDRPLGRPVGREALALHGDEAGRDVDDAAPARVEQVRHGGACHQEDAVDVGVDDHAPGVGLDGPERRARLDEVLVDVSHAAAGVVDQAVDDTELGQRLAHDALAILLGRDIGLERQDAVLATNLARIGGGFFELRPFARRGDGDLGAGPDKPQPWPWPPEPDPIDLFLL